MQSNKITDALVGLAVGDALGVPFEFKSTKTMLAKPATEMVGYGTHNQPLGTWSDDSSLTFCLAESLCEGYDLADMAQKFIDWRDRAYWTAHNKVFDIGITTNEALSRLKLILAKKEYEKLKNLKFEGTERDNGNGSLMRILPLLFYIKGMESAKQFELVWEVSALTHRHIRAAMACFIYLKLAEYLLNGVEKKLAYQETRKDTLALWEKIQFETFEKTHFSRLIENSILELETTDLKSGGYVIESLEASFWCFLKENNYQDAVLSAVNFGHDTDTTAAITGGLAGLYYGTAEMPKHWVSGLVRLNDILALADRLLISLSNKPL